MALLRLKDLLGDDVLAVDDRIGALRDLYFDCDCGQVRYLVVADGCSPRKRPLLVSAALARRFSRLGVRVSISRTQLEYGAGAWPLETARGWLDGGRLCSAAHALGYAVQAQDGSAGMLVDLLIDDEHWLVDYALVDCHDGMRRRQVLVPLHWVAAIDVARKALRVRRTRQELEHSPGP